MCGPELSDVAFTFGQQYDSTQLQIIGINRGEDINTIQQFVKTFGITYPVLLDTDGSVWVSYKIQGISPFPLDCIVDQDGIVRYLNSEYDPQVMLDVLDQLISTNDSTPPDDEIVPDRLTISLFPNPTNSATLVQFAVPHSDEVVLTLYDITGKVVVTRRLGIHAVGTTITYQLQLDQQASSVYVVSVRNGPFHDSKKLVLVR